MMKRVAREGFKETLPGVLSRVVSCILVDAHLSLCMKCVDHHTASIMEVHWSSNWFLCVWYVNHVYVCILKAPNLQPVIMCMWISCIAYKASYNDKEIFLLKFHLGVDLALL